MPVPLDQGHLCAKTCGADGADQARRTGADNHQMVAGPRRGVFVILRARQPPQEIWSKSAPGWVATVHVGASVVGVARGSRLFIQRPRGESGKARQPVPVRQPWVKQCVSDRRLGQLAIQQGGKILCNGAQIHIEQGAGNHAEPRHEDMRFSKSTLVRPRAWFNKLNGNAGESRVSSTTKPPARLPPDPEQRT